MAWANDKTGSNIPAAVKREVLNRDGGQCQLRYPVCTGAHEIFDHVHNLAARGIDRRDDKPTADDLQCVCRSCHKWKTALEARAGRQRRRTQPRRPARRHPGLLW
jgi:5-methylcytosine-specific restriction endonuclease McrA